MGPARPLGFLGGSGSGILHGLGQGRILGLHRMLGSKGHSLGGGGGKPHRKEQPYNPKPSTLGGDGAHHGTKGALAFQIPPKFSTQIGREGGSLNPKPSTLLAWAPI